MQQQSDHTSAATSAGPDVSPDEAQRRLAAAGTARLGSPRDRQVHGYATMAMGVVIGVYIAAQEALDGVAGWLVLVAVGIAAPLLAAGALIVRGDSR